MGWLVLLGFVEVSRPNSNEWAAFPGAPATSQCGQQLSAFGR
jgi:hypothetical protein